MRCLSLNAPLMVEADGETDPLKVRDSISCHIISDAVAQIAAKELKAKKIPFTIRRYLPDGRSPPISSALDGTAAL